MYKFVHLWYANDIEKKVIGGKMQIDNNFNRYSTFIMENVMHMNVMHFTEYC